MVSNSEKMIKTNIEDENVKAEVLSMIKEYKKKTKQLKKEEEIHQKEFIDLFSRRDVTKDSFSEVHNELVEVRKKRQDLYIDYSLNLKNKLTVEEWSAMLPEAIKSLDKKKKKKEKYLNNIEKVDKKTHEKLIDKIEDQERREELDNLFINFINKDIELHEAIFNLNIKDNEVIQNKYSKREDYELITDSINYDAEEFFQLYMQFHEDLVRLTTEEEWKIVKKPMKDIYK